MPRAGSSIPVEGGAGFAIEFHPATVGSEHRSTVRLTVGPRGRYRLNGTGMSALLGVFNTYLSGAKCTAIRSRGGDNTSPAVTVSPDGAVCDILPEDGTALAASITAVLNTIANIAT